MTKYFKNKSNKYSDLNLTQTSKTSFKDSFNAFTAMNLRNILGKDLEGLYRSKIIKRNQVIQKKQNRLNKTKPKPELDDKEKSKKYNPFKLFMRSGSKLQKRLNSSQNSRYKIRLNTNKLNVKDNFDQLSKHRVHRKVKSITKNPRFYNNVKEKIQESLRMLSNVRQGGRMNEQLYYSKLGHRSKRDKDHSVISLIRREESPQESRVFSAFSSETKNLRFMPIKNTPISSQNNLKGKFSSK